MRERVLELGERVFERAENVATQVDVRHGRFHLVDHVGHRLENLGRVDGPDAREHRVEVLLLELL